jgi:hypothetical protein
MSRLILVLCFIFFACNLRAQIVAAESIFGYQKISVAKNLWSIESVTISPKDGRIFLVMPRAFQYHSACKTRSDAWKLMEKVPGAGLFELVGNRFIYHFAIDADWGGKLIGEICLNCTIDNKLYIAKAELVNHGSYDEEIERVSLYDLRTMHEVFYRIRDIKELYCDYGFRSVCYDPKANQLVIDFEYDYPHRISPKIGKFKKDNLFLEHTWESDDNDDWYGMYSSIGYDLNGNFVFTNSKILVSPRQTHRFHRIKPLGLPEQQYVCFDYFGQNPKSGRYLLAGEWGEYDSSDVLCGSVIFEMNPSTGQCDIVSINIGRSIKQRLIANKNGTFYLITDPEEPYYDKKKDCYYPSTGLSIEKLIPIK